MVLRPKDRDVNRINKDVIIRLLKKSMLYRLMSNTDKLLSDLNLTHRELSNRIGNADNWFNDAFNNYEDIRLSSFTRVLSVIQQEINLESYNLTTIFDDTILNIGLLIGGLSDEDDEEHIKNIIILEKSLFTDLIGDWAPMKQRNRLSDMEKETVQKINILIDSNN